MTKEEFWNKHNTLLSGHFYKEIKENSEFVHYKSVFKQKSYNFLKPKIPSKEFTWTTAQKTIEKEAETGYELSFYISEELLNDYRKPLEELGYTEIESDIFLVKTITREYEIDTEDFIEVNSVNFNEFQKIVQETFPEYDNNKEYTEFCFAEFEKHRDQFLNYMQVKGGKATSFGSLLMSPAAELGFLHNMGTLERFRRQGQFSSLTKFLSNIALHNGINTTYANVCMDSSSYNGFKKLGYNEISSNYIFSKP